MFQSLLCVCFFLRVSSRESKTARLARSSLDELVGICEHRVDAPDARANIDAQALAIDALLYVEARIDHGLMGRHDGILCEEVVTSDLGRTQKRRRIEVLDLGSHLDLIVSRIKLRDFADARDTGLECLPAVLQKYGVS